MHTLDEYHSALEQRYTDGGKTSELIDKKENRKQKEKKAFTTECIVVENKLTRREYIDLH